MEKWRRVYLMISFAALLHAQAKFAPSPAPDSQPSPDGKWLAWSQWDLDVTPETPAAVYVRAVTGGPIKTLATTDDRNAIPLNPQWAPDGKRILILRMFDAHASQASLIEISTGLETRSEFLCDPHGKVSWSPDSRYLVAGTPVKPHEPYAFCHVTLLSASDGKVVRTLTTSGNVGAISTDSRWLVYGDGENLMIRGLGAGYVTAGAPRRVAHEPREIVSVEWTRDNKVIYEVGGDRLYRRRIGIAPGAKPEKQSGLGWVPVDELTAGATRPATLVEEKRNVWRADLTAKEITFEPLDWAAQRDCRAGAPGCSADGTRRFTLSILGGITMVWASSGDMRTDRLLLTQAPGFENGYGLWNSTAVSPDGAWLAFTVTPAVAHGDHRAPLYLLPFAGGPPHAIATKTYGMYGSVWSIDGKALFAEMRAYSFGGPRTLVKIDPATGAVTDLGENGWWPKPTLDGRFLYFMQGDRSSHWCRMELATRKVEEFPEIETESGLPRLTAAGKQALYTVSSMEGKRVLIRFDPVSRQSQILAPWTLSNDSQGSLSLSPDERFLYFDQDALSGF